jgi:hypothetical protein
MNRPPRTHLFVDQLSREWEGLRRRPTELTRARGWRAKVSDTHLLCALDGVVDLDQIVDVTNPVVSAEVADAALLQLVELAQHDQLAGRLIIQRLLPGLIARAAPYRNRCDGIDPAEVVVAAAWIAIRQYDAANRRRFVAASLISDATFQAFRRHLRRRSASEYAAPGELFASRVAPPHSTTAFEQLAEVVRVARQHGVSTTDLQLVRELVQIGSANLVAAHHGVTPRTIRNRRDRAVANIRDAVNAA